MERQGGQFVEQMLMLSSSFRYDQIYKYEIWSHFVVMVKSFNKTTTDDIWNSKSFQVRWNICRKNSYFWAL